MTWGHPPLQHRSAPDCEAARPAAHGDTLTWDTLPSVGCQAQGHGVQPLPIATRLGTGPARHAPVLGCWQSTQEPGVEQDRPLPVQTLFDFFPAKRCRLADVISAGAPLPRCCLLLGVSCCLVGFSFGSS